MSTQKIKFGSVPEGDEYKPRFNEPILAVLVANPRKPGMEREWAVYYGPESKGEEYIRTKGSKLDREFAKILFPNVEGRYRD